MPARKSSMLFLVFKDNNMNKGLHLNKGVTLHKFNLSNNAGD